jgi:hypothetical protein
MCIFISTSSPRTKGGTKCTWCFAGPSGWFGAVLLTGTAWVSPNFCAFLLHTQEFLFVLLCNVNFQYFCCAGFPVIQLFTLKCAIDKCLNVDLMAPSSLSVQISFILNALLLMPATSFFPPACIYSHYGFYFHLEYLISFLPGLISCCSIDF